MKTIRIKGGDLHFWLESSFFQINYKGYYLPTHRKSGLSFRIKYN